VEIKISQPDHQNYLRTDFKMVIEEFKLPEWAFFMGMANESEDSFAFYRTYSNHSLAQDVGSYQKKRYFF
jgi:hypothetical protein